MIACARLWELRGKETNGILAGVLILTAMMVLTIMVLTLSTMVVPTLSCMRVSTMIIIMIEQAMMSKGTSVQNRHWIANCSAHTVGAESRRFEVVMRGERSQFIFFRRTDHGPSNSNDELESSRWLSSECHTGIASLSEQRPKVSTFCMAAREGAQGELVLASRW
jgi:hypothetical protein